MLGWLREHLLTFHLCLAASGILLVAVGLAVQAADNPPPAAASSTTLGDERAAAKTPAGATWPDAMKMLAAAAVICFTAFATALTQCRIGTAGIGALAENPKLFGSVLVLLVVPETMVILGFVVAALMLF
ncbi:MAG: hypothetical protein MUE50_01680 [Pirellulaceae bacterium]|jgi:V/A-type H+-transporting ATPase subunit K|nr:hypothetical protein [Pirellulaceae bacterium]MCU0980830.1 hypothetical protein [Pirellulaceae bacterium]